LERFEPPFSLRRKKTPSYFCDWSWASPM
jgi:hypothetical protein